MKSIVTVLAFLSVLIALGGVSVAGSGMNMNTGELIIFSDPGPPIPSANSRRESAYKESKAAHRAKVKKMKKASGQKPHNSWQLK